MDGSVNDDFAAAKQAKLDRIRPLLAREPEIETALHFNFLTEAVRERHGIVDTDAVSEHPYDPFALDIINSNADGLVLDCGAGRRATYLPNVVNYEIVPYDSTDVLGPAEELPFRDAVFDGALCLNVLEHVRDPFRAAREIARVMKPDARLYCVVPFLQARHGYPHHYYNMTSEGLQNLFVDVLHIDRAGLLLSGLPVWSVHGMLSSWLGGLAGATRERFLRLTVAELLRDPVAQLQEDYVTALSDEKNFELATTTAVFATKRR